MTRGAYRKLVAGHLRWSVIGLIVALFIAFISSDHRLVVYGMPAADTPEIGVSDVPALLPCTAPASAPKESVDKVVPDTINGELVWPDPWDKIREPLLRNY